MAPAIRLLVQDTHYQNNVVLNEIEYAMTSVREAAQARLDLFDDGKATRMISQFLGPLPQAIGVTCRRLQAPSILAISHD